MKILIDLFNLVVKNTKTTLSDSLQKSTLQMIHMLIQMVTTDKDVSEEVFNEFKVEAINLIQVVLQTF